LCGRFQACKTPGYSMPVARATVRCIHWRRSKGRVAGWWSGQPVHPAGLGGEIAADCVSGPWWHHWTWCWLFCADVSQRVKRLAILCRSLARRFAAGEVARTSSSRQVSGRIPPPSRHLLALFHGPFVRIFVKFLSVVGSRRIRAKLLRNKNFLSLRCRFYCPVLSGFRLFFRTSVFRVPRGLVGRSRWVHLSKNGAAAERRGARLETEAHFARRLIIGFGWAKTNCVAWE
jgi:hypothetical protein